jgi:hypothetical protein
MDIYPVLLKVIPGGEACQNLDITSVTGAGIHITDMNGTVTNGIFQ